MNIEKVILQFCEIVWPEIRGSAFAVLRDGRWEDHAQVAFIPGTDVAILFLDYGFGGFFTRNEISKWSLVPLEEIEKT